MYKKRYVHEISEALLTQEENLWLTAIDNERGVSGRGQNKLMTYRLMKGEYKTENYSLSCLPLKHRSAFAKFRCGVTPIRIETGGYEGLEVDSRTCPICKNGIRMKNMSFLCVRCMMVSENIFLTRQLM